MYMPNDPSLFFLAGSRIKSFHPFVPFDPILCEFLMDLSSKLIKRPESRTYPDIMAFAFWCRKGNIRKIRKVFEDGLIRLGLGLVFHITPSNVPVNFAFSFAFGLLSGNANIVRTPSTIFPQVDVICEEIKNLMHLKKYAEINSMNAIINYSQKDNITKFFSTHSNARLIWGGDKTINKIRSFSVPERCVDIAFSDRYSFCVIKTEAILEIDEKQLVQLSEHFYNDTYLMDQNACSSPHLLVWLGNKGLEAKERFWTSLFKVVQKKYDLKLIQAVDKFTSLCKNAIEIENIKSINRKGNLIYRILLDKLPENMDTLRGQFGYFYEFDAENINQLSHIVNKSYQTMTYFGLSESDLSDFVVKNRLFGIDNITPVGTALDIGVFWDGYDIIRSLSRTINVR